MKGFVISNIFDVTDDQAISAIKSSLIGGDKTMKKNSIEEFQEVFQSLLNIKDLKVGFSIYNKDEHTFESRYGKRNINSFLLNNKKSDHCATCLCSSSYKLLMEEHKYVSFSNVFKNYDKYKNLSLIHI